MAKYIKQEVPDMLKTGNQKVFYRLKTERNIDFDEFVSRMAHPGSGFMRVKHYMELTGLGHTTAANELRAFSDDLSTGITIMGRGSAKVYVRM